MAAVVCPEVGATSSASGGAAAPGACHICREVTDLSPRPVQVDGCRTALRVTCDACQDLVGAPLCRACGKRVRDAVGDPDPYHVNCRRCSSCSQVVPKQEVGKLAGRIFCNSCDHLFGAFLVPRRRPHSERMKEAF